MKTKFKFTNERIKALPPHAADSASRSAEYSDIGVTGLRCLISKSSPALKGGSKRWLLRYRFQSKKKSIAIGEFPEVDVAAARRIAMKHKAMIADGIDPKAERVDETPQVTVSEFFWSTYLPLIKKRNRSWYHDQLRFKNHAEPKFGHLSYRDLKAIDIQQLQLAMNSPTKHRKAYANGTCNRVLGILKTMGEMAVKLDVLEINEAMKIKQLRENNARTRFLDADEMKRLIVAARQYPNRSVGALVAVLALTGARNAEIRMSKYDYLNVAEKTLFVPMTKNGNSRHIYLSELAMEIIGGLARLPGNPYIFTGAKAGLPIRDCRVSFRNILLKAGINPEDLVLHSLRHSVASNLVSAGVSLYLVRDLLGHLNINSTQRYSKVLPESLRQTSNKMSELISQC